MKILSMFKSIGMLGGRVSSFVLALKGSVRVLSDIWEGLEV